MKQQVRELDLRLKYIETKAGELAQRKDLSLAQINDLKELLMNSLGVIGLQIAVMLSKELLPEETAIELLDAVYRATERLIAVVEIM